MKNSKDETLQDALKELMRHIRSISKLEQEIDEKWGVRMRVSYIGAPRKYIANEVFVNRGLEAIARALDEPMKTSEYSRFSREVHHYGIEFRQMADGRTKVFVKAGQEPPDVRIVEEDEP